MAIHLIKIKFNKLHLILCVIFRVNICPINAVDRAGDCEEVRFVGRDHWLNFV